MLTLSVNLVCLGIHVLSTRPIYLKRVFVFADGSHAIAAAQVARDEMGFEVVGLGTCSRQAVMFVKRRKSTVRGTHYRQLP